MSNDDMWADSIHTANDDQWASSLHTSNDELWLSSTVVEAVARYVRLLLKAVDNTYRGIAKELAYRLKSKDKVYRLTTKKDGHI